MITKRDLTTGEAEGSGLFDELMRTGKSHLRMEFDSGRLTGTEYSQVYLNMLQSNLQAATQFVLQQDVTNQQVLLAQEQLKQAQKQNELLDLQIAQLTLANAAAQYNLDNMLPKQLEQLGLQNTQITEQTQLVEVQTLQATAQTAMVSKQEDMVDQQILSEIAKTVNPTGGLSKVTFDKGLAEIDLLSQKKETEAAQTVGTLDTLGGLVAAEITLKNTQKDSFLRDAEQKAAKMYTDVFATLYATDPDDEYVFPEQFGFDQSTAQQALKKLLGGVGVTTTTMATPKARVAV